MANGGDERQIIEDWRRLKNATPIYVLAIMCCCLIGLGLGNLGAYLLGGLALTAGSVAFGFMVRNVARERRAWKRVLEVKALKLSPPSDCSE